MICTYGRTVALVLPSLFILYRTQTVPYFYNGCASIITSPKPPPLGRTKIFPTPPPRGGVEPERFLAHGDAVWVFIMDWMMTCRSETSRTCWLAIFCTDHVSPQTWCLFCTRCCNVLSDVWHLVKHRVAYVNKNIIVYPHLDWNIEFENEEALYKHVNKVMNQFNLYITFWTKNSFTTNDTGFWTPGK